MKWTDRKIKGQSVLEFMLVAFPLLLLMLGIAEFSRAWWTASILTDAAREAARVYARDPAFGGGVGPAISIADSILGSNRIIGATYVPFDDGVPFGTVTWTVNYNFQSVVGGFIPGLNGYPLKSTTSMRKEYP